MIKSLDAKILIQILDAKIYRKFILRRSIIEMTSTWPGLTVSERKITMGEVNINEKKVQQACLTILSHTRLEKMKNLKGLLFDCNGLNSQIIYISIVIFHSFNRGVP